MIKESVAERMSGRGAGNKLSNLLLKISY